MPTRDQRLSAYEVTLDSLNDGALRNLSSETLHDLLEVDTLSQALNIRKVVLRRRRDRKRQQRLRMIENRLRDVWPNVEAVDGNHRILVYPKGAPTSKLPGEVG